MQRFERIATIELDTFESYGRIVVAPQHRAYSIPTGVAVADALTALDAAIGALYGAAVSGDPALYARVVETVARAGWQPADKAMIALARGA